MVDLLVPNQREKVMRLMGWQEKGEADNSPYLIKQELTVAVPRKAFDNASFKQAQLAAQGLIAARDLMIQRIEKTLMRLEAIATDPTYLPPSKNGASKLTQ